MNNYINYTDRHIREYLGHNGVECRVVIHRDGLVEQYGSPESTDRSHDYWQYMGQRDEIVRQMQDY